MTRFRRMHRPIGKHIEFDATNANGREIRVSCTVSRGDEGIYVEDVVICDGLDFAVLPETEAVGDVEERAIECASDEDEADYEREYDRAEDRYDRA